MGGLAGCRNFGGNSTGAGLMRKQRRWMKWVFEEVETFDTVLPWSRFAPRGRGQRHLKKQKLRAISS